MHLHVFAVECLPSRKTVCAYLIMYFESTAAICPSLSSGSSKMGVSVTKDTIALVMGQAAGTGWQICRSCQSECES